jgi:hypothetical protein
MLETDADAEDYKAIEIGPFQTRSSCFKAPILSEVI